VSLPPGFHSRIDLNDSLAETVKFQLALVELNTGPVYSVPLVVRGTLLSVEDMPHMSAAIVADYLNPPSVRNHAHVAAPLVAIDHLVEARPATT